MRKRLITFGWTVLMILALTVSAFAAGDDVPPMNAYGFFVLAMMSGALAAAVGLVVHYMKKFRDYNSTEQKKNPKNKKK